MPCHCSSPEKSFDGMSMVSIISVRLGCAKDWFKVLSPVLRAKYNGIHFTPLQQLGDSGSSYSIEDHLRCNPIFGNQEEIEDNLSRLKRDYDVSVCTDIVLNHMANSAPFLREHPEAGYTEETAPWLKAAIDLDNLFRAFTKDLCEKKIPGCSVEVKSQSDINRLCDAFEKSYLTSRQFSLRDWFTVNVEESLENYRRFKNDDQGNSARAIQPSAAEPGARCLYDALLRVVGESRNFVIPGQYTSQFAPHNEATARDAIASAQKELWTECNAVKTSIMAALRGTLDYERLQQKKGPITYTPWNSAAPWYFTPVTTASGEVRHLANNGWVMGWNSSRDFVDRGTLVYLRRSLVAWSDCVKIRYGAKEGDSPAVWELMRKYVRLCANMFDGVRLDNCHTTPMQVAKVMLEEARAIKPNLLVFAELFTGSETQDRKFEAELGIHGLVREAMQTSSPGDQSWHSVKYSVHSKKEVGELDDRLEETPPIIVQAPTSTTPTPGFTPGSIAAQPRAHNMYYDLTHDNETCAQKRRVADTLAAAAIVSASGCSVGSTFGYDMLFAANPSVLYDGRLYAENYRVCSGSEAEKERSEKKSEENRESPTNSESTVAANYQLNYPSLSEAELGKYTIVWFHYESPTATKADSVHLWGAFNRWKDGILMAKWHERWWYVKICTPSNDAWHAKFVVNGSEWMCGNQYKRVWSGGNENNDLSSPTQTANPIEMMAKSRTQAVEKMTPKFPPLDIGASCGIVEARRVLNEIHQQLTQFTEITIQHLADDMCCISRHQPDTGEAYHFIVRSAWWYGPVNPSTKYCSIIGDVVGGEPVFCLRCEGALTPPASHDKRITGLCGDSSALRCVEWPETHYEGAGDVTHVNFKKPFPSGSVCIFKTCVRRADAGVQSALELLASEWSQFGLKPWVVGELLWSSEPEERERSSGESGVYQFPDIRPVAYAGFAGAVDAVMETRLSHPDWRAKGFYRNVREGDWLLKYHGNRVARITGADYAGPEAHRLSLWFRDVVDSQLMNPRHPGTKTRAVEKLFVGLYKQCVHTLLASGQKDWILRASSPLAGWLAASASQMVGCVPSASLNFEDKSRVPYTTSAGLPHFTTQFFREWGRDTMLSLPGLTVAMGGADGIEYMTNTILAYARVIRHGMIPNLLDSSNNPRYNARDAVWFWLTAIRRCCELSCTDPNVGVSDADFSIFQQPIVLKYPPVHHGSYDTPFEIHTLGDCVRYVLYTHYHGIEYREWNAGKEIDSRMVDEGFNVHIYRDQKTGFIMGGNPHNCGTWMDNMGASSEAGNLGKPATPRVGAPVELTLATYSFLRWMCGNAKRIFTAIDADSASTCNPPCSSSGSITEVELRSYQEWADQIKANFEQSYFISEAEAASQPSERAVVAGTLKDTYGSTVSGEDWYLRCNYSIGLALCRETDIIQTPNRVKRALDLAYEYLVCDPDQVGMKTLAPRNILFNPAYDNACNSTNFATALGYNYHNGPEWGWPLGCWFEAYVIHVIRPALEAGCLCCASKVHDSSTGKEEYIPPHADSFVCARTTLFDRLQPLLARVSSGPWFSLPEVTDKNGGVCKSGCQAQAWSVATFIQFFHTYDRLINSYQPPRCDGAPPALHVPTSDPAGVVLIPLPAVAPLNTTHADEEFSSSCGGDRLASSVAPPEPLVEEEVEEVRDVMESPPLHMEVDSSPNNPIPRAADFIDSDDYEDADAEDAED